MDLMFGFNDVNHSNKTLRIVILPSDHHHRCSGSKPLLNSNRNCSNRGSDSGKVSPGPRKKLINSEEDNTRVLFEKDMDTEMATDDQSGDEKIEITKLIHVNSLILARHSLYFRNMFSNGMKESRQQHADIHIQAFEEDAFIDLLKFMYSGALSSTSTLSSLLDVVMVADKFDVPSCIKMCAQLILSFPMTLELALLYLDRDSTPDSIRPYLENSAKNFLVQHFEDIESTKLREELLKLPLTGVEVVLSSDYLQIKSEDEICDFIFEWVKMHYSNQLEERRKMLNMLVGRFLRFPFLSSAKMQDILTCTDIDPTTASKIAVGALRYHRSEPLDQQADPINNFVKREYILQPLKMVSFDDSPSHPQCIVYLDLERDEIKCMVSASGGDIIFNPFFLGKYKLVVFATMEESTFGLYFGVPGSGIDTTGLTINCEIACRRRASRKFRKLVERTIIPAKGTPDGWSNLFELPGEKFISKDNHYFVNDILHLRCHLTVL